MRNPFSQNQSMIVYIYCVRLDIIMKQQLNSIN